jgi:hypothetical protein
MIIIASAFLFSVLILLLFLVYANLKVHTELDERYLSKNLYEINKKQDGFKKRKAYVLNTPEIKCFLQNETKTYKIKLKINHNN